ncbi:hypothetical protein MKW94_009559, partial [Papaver nudicaule]|nr:hypothetical protein [Papaver nudicaule]
SGQERKSLKPTLVTLSTPPSSLDVSNRSGGKPPVSKSSSESLAQLLENINKDSLYDSRYQPSPTSLSFPPSSSSPR